MNDMGKEPDVKMSYLDFVGGTVLNMGQTSFTDWRDALVDTYIKFSVFEKEEVSQEIMAEKLCDFFEKAELKTGKTFEKFVEIYFANIDSIVAGRVAKAPQQRKKDEAPLPVPRARKYYDKTLEIKKRKLNLATMVDYTRIMMCLYAAIIENKGAEIVNFNYAVSSLKIDEIVNAMLDEAESIPFNLAKKKKFDTKDPYGTDAITMIIAITMLHKIVDDSVEGGNEDE